MTVNPPPSSGMPHSEPDTGARGQPIGMLLRRTREGRKIGLTQAASSLRIRQVYLEAIEKCAYERLPGPAYAIGFVRAYADYLGLDGEEAVRRFKREVQGFDRQPDLTLPEPIRERSIPGGRILVAALVLAICGYGLWYYLGSANRHHADAVADVPAVLEKDAPTPSEANAAVQHDGAEPPKPDMIPPEPEKLAAAPVVEVPPPPPLPPGKIYGVADGPVRIVLRATGDCWIQIKGGSPDATFGKLLNAGDVYRVPSQSGMTVRIGDSDKLAIELDGRLVTLPPALSRVRNVALDPEQLTAWAGPAPAPAPAPPPMPAPTPAAAPAPPPATVPATKAN